mmetsp:Transcript_67184/g.160933  ORF Transcript_67184/g.160933 Transcript_67184/m.160933 type:complete len:157 (-) Transcript_67184:2-472(-)
MGATDLTFPQLPPWPPSTENRAAYIHWWLCVFMTGVGGLKAAGFLQHDLSRIVGVLEFIGGALLLPRWQWISDKSSLGPETLLRLGIWTVLAGLGVIISTKKRKSPVCWSQVLLALEVLRARQGNSAAAMGVAAAVAGTLLGVVLGMLLLAPQKTA